MYENRVKRFKIFVDFDGTITTTDIGEKMFLDFSCKEQNSETILRWEDGEISSQEMWKIMCKATKNFNEEKFLDFLLQVELDEAFLKFVKFCETYSHEIFILSDGFDYYIKEVLKQNDIIHLKTFSNYLSFDKSKNLLPSFPYTDSECDSCANCKRNHIIENSADDDYTVYIGDGGSDKCPVQYVDFIFAKKDLLKFCEKNRITYFPYINFHNVIRKLEELQKKKRLKKRHQAELKRREVYLQG